MDDNPSIVYVGYYKSDMVHSSLFSGGIVCRGMSDDAVHSYSYDSGRVVSPYSERAEVEYVLDYAAAFLEEDPSTRFMLFMPNEVQHDLPGFPMEAIACINSSAVYSSVDSKLFARYWLSSYTKILPYTIVARGDLNYAALRKSYPRSTSFVVQSEYGSGGDATFRIDCADDAQRLSQTPRRKASRMMVSPLVEGGLSVNQHVLIMLDDVIAFQPSIQVIRVKEDAVFTYDGADYGRYLRLLFDTPVHTTIMNSTKAIGRALSRIGYRGIAGIDYLVCNGSSAFIEINPRFQGSSAVLSRALMRNHLPDLYELNYNAFYPSKRINVSKIAPDIEALRVHGRCGYIENFSEADIVRAKEYREPQVTGMNRSYDYYSPDAVLCMTSSDSFLE